MKIDKLTATACFPLSLAAWTVLATLAFAHTLAAQDTDWLRPVVPGEDKVTSLRVGDDAPAFSLRAYNEDIALRLVKSPLVGLNFFVGIRPEYQKEVVLLAFLTAESQKDRHDLATLQKLYKKYKGNGVMVLAVSLDKEDPQTVYDALDRANVTFPVLRDRFAVVARRYDVKQLPTLFVIDKNGKIQSIGENYSGDVEAYLDTKIRDLLAGI